MTDVQKALADLKARQEAGEHMPCPRCGRNTMKPALYTNALSRVADGIMVCDDCGTQEALLAFMQNPMPVEAFSNAGHRNSPARISESTGGKHTSAAPG